MAGAAELFAQFGVGGGVQDQGVPPVVDDVRRGQADAQGRNSRGRLVAETANRPADGLLSQDGLGWLRMALGVGDA
ncbi:hypothetical protein CIB93_01140 [Streptomyces sp. WZ.A104]|nr:hypothetical protein CIB93_01140 [Streptomyces sp. WZ.A104]